MCWSLEASAVASVWGFGVSLYLCRRDYSARDSWYALFLATFTATQVFDAYFWWSKGSDTQIPCTRTNLALSKYLLPVVIFHQPWVIAKFPSSAYPRFRNAYRVLVVVGACVLIAAWGCTVVAPSAVSGKPEIVWGGAMPAEWVIWCGIALWAGGAFLFCTPWFVWAQILLVGGTVLSLLAQFDGTIRLLSKMCTYCLLLSIVWVLEPMWDPSRTRTRRQGAALTAFAPGQSAIMLVPTCSAESGNQAGERRKCPEGGTVYAVDPAYFAQG